MPTRIQHNLNIQIIAKRTKASEIRSKQINSIKMSTTINLRHLKCCTLAAILIVVALTASLIECHYGLKRTQYHEQVSGLN